MLGFKLNHVSKRGPWKHTTYSSFWSSKLNLLSARLYIYRPGPDQQCVSRHSAYWKIGRISYYPSTFLWLSMLLFRSDDINQQHVRFRWWTRHSHSRFVRLQSAWYIMKYWTIKVKLKKKMKQLKCFNKLNKRFAVNAMNKCYKTVLDFYIFFGTKHSKSKYSS